MKTPILDALKNLAGEKNASFHTPGHKAKNTLVDWGKLIPKIDTTEVYGMDNLLEASGIIKDSQEFTAGVFGARHTRYSLNGSTGSIYIALATIAEPGDSVLIQRDCHKAVYNGLILNRLNPIYIYPNYNQDYNMYTGLDPGQIDAMLEANKDIKAVVVTYPNYFGICSDLGKITDIVHKHGRIIMVDEAHGSHLSFSARLPKSALSCGADIVVQSTHKTLPSFTQTSMIHIGTGRIDIERLDDRFQLYTSSSPSYLFMASCEIAAAYMGTSEARERLEENISRCLEASEKLNSMDGVFAFTGDRNDRSIHSKDPTKILFKIDGMDGRKLQGKLYEKHGVMLEMADYHYGLALTSLMNDAVDYRRLVGAVEDLSQGEMPGKAGLFKVKIPEPVISLPIYEAYHLPRRLVKLKEGIGSIAAKPIIPYPPGIPLIVAGEIITEELYENIIFLIQNNIEIVGLMGYNRDKVSIIDKGE